MKLRLYCLCGASVVGSASEQLGRRMVERFWESHSGPGHGETTRQKAAAVRRRERRAWLKGAMHDA